jgi:hypothetical protein
MSLVMRATLHDRATNPSYGQWLGKNARKHATKRGAIAHSALMASAGFGALEVPQPDFPGNRPPARWKFVDRPEMKNLRAGPKARLH